MDLGAKHLPSSRPRAEPLEPWPVVNGPDQRPTHQGTPPYPVRGCSPVSKWQAPALFNFSNTTPVLRCLNPSAQGSNRKHKSTGLVDLFCGHCLLPVIFAVLLKQWPQHTLPTRVGKSSRQGEVGGTVGRPPHIFCENIGDAGWPRYAHSTSTTGYQVSS